MTPKRIRSGIQEVIFLDSDQHGQNGALKSDSNSCGLIAAFKSFRNYYNKDSLLSVPESFIHDVWNRER